MKMFFLLLLFISTASVVAVEETEGMRAMRLGCEKQKLGLGCTNYANFLIKNGRESEADAYFEKGCKLGHQDGCDKKRWPVKEVIVIEPEPVVESPIEVAPEEPAVSVEVTPEPTSPVESTLETSVPEPSTPVETITEPNQIDTPAPSPADEAIIPGAEEANITPATETVVPAEGESAILPGN